MGNTSQSGGENQEKCHTSVVTVKEREGAAEAVMKLVQQQAFHREIKLLEA